MPAATWIGQGLGWRSAFAVVALIGALTVAAIALRVPPLHDVRTTDPRTELSALRRGQVWLTLVVATVGFGGMFAVYTYVGWTMTDVAGLPVTLVPVALMVYGLGMVAGNILGGRLADRALTPGLFAILAALVGSWRSSRSRRTIPSPRCSCCSSSPPPVRRSCPACRPG